jgi:hypothetical protein
VERLSGKPVELGPGSPQGVGIPASWGNAVVSLQAGAPPKGWGSRPSMNLVVPCGPGAQQSLRGGGGGSRGVDIPVECGSSTD